MKQLALSLYHSLPAPARNVAASVRGLYLRRLRYGAETEQLVAAAFEREQWSVRQLQAWQQEQLARILERAAKRVPYYREHWAQRRQRGDKASWELIENWPLLTKQTLKANARAFLADDCDPRRMVHEHTSGTTGTPLHFWLSRRTVRAWYALTEARWRRWYGLSQADRWAILGGQLVAPARQRKPPFWVWNAGMRQLYMSSYHLAPENIPAYLDALRRHRVAYLLGYASSMYALAQVALAQQLAAPQLRYAISNAEPLYAHQREAIAAAFKCEVRDSYGMSEAVCAASECQAGRMHLWPEAGIVEMLADDTLQAVPAGQTGRLVCTGLLNPDMPLIRYEVGDRGALAPTDDACACGRRLPVLQQIEGRMDDVVLTPTGRRIGRLDPVFKTDMPIQEAQIIQESVRRLRVRLVPTAAYTEQDGAMLVKRMREHVGDMEIVVERVAQIERTTNGKFRAVVNQLKTADGELRV